MVARLGLHCWGLRWAGAAAADIQGAASLGPAMNAAQKGLQISCSSVACSVHAALTGRER